MRSPPPSWAATAPSIPSTQISNSMVLLDVELHALGERQLLAVVDGVGGAAHISLPGIRARLAAAAGFLLAAESAADLGAGGADVDIGDAAIRAGGGNELLGLAEVLGE